MKKNILNLTAIALIATASVFTGCKKDDTTAPVVTVTGGDQTISLNGTYTELGATAEDDKDGTLTVSVSGTVNEDLADTYTITYTATDAAGNVGTATRTVYVQNDAYDWAGTYSVLDTCSGPLYFSYSQIVTASTTENNKIMFNKFADYSNNGNIYATVAPNGLTATLPGQTATGIGSAVESHTFSGSAVKTATGFRLTYTDVNNSAGGASATCNATFTK